MDVSRALAAGVKPIADRTVGTLACADDFYDTLRADIAKVLPHVAVGVEKVARIFPGDPLALRVAKAIAALQAIEGFPRTAENMAALLYPAVGAPSLLEPVREGLRKLVAEKECGVVDDPQSGGYLFLSEGVKPLRDKRNAYVPTGTEINQLRARILASIFDPPPSVMLEGVKKVEAGLRHGKAQVLGEHADIQFRVEAVEAASLAVRRQALLAETNTPEYRNTIALLIAFSGEVDDLLVEACRSDRILQAIPERDADRDVAQFLRAERRQMDASKERAQKAIAKTLYDGVFIFRGGPTAVVEAGATLEAAARNILSRAATDIFSLLRLVAIRPTTDLAAKFLAIERLDRMPKECDPLGFVVPRGGRAGVQVTHPALTEALRAFQQKVDESGAGRLQGGAIQDFFAAAPYGWSKDATRYVFAALLVAGEIELHTPEGVLKTAGPKSIDAFKSTVAFNRAGVSRRDSRPPLETLDRAATRLQEMFGVEVLPLEDHISRAVRTHVPGLIEKVGSLPDRLRLLGLAGEERARYLIETCADLLKEDASGAAVLLGAVECTVPSNAKWARAVTDVLSTGGEADILAAWKVRRDLEELAALFPAQGRGLLAQADEETLREALHSESFHERLPDLRGAVSRTLDRVKGRFAERREAYETDLKAALAALEAMPEWLQLGDEDREEIARNLTDAAVPAEARPGEEVADLRLLLARSASLPSLRTQLEAEVRRRVPKPSEPPLPSEPTVEELLDISELAPADMLRTSTDLENWLSAIRNRLMALLRSNKYVRFKGGRGDELR